jgi:hypothetical protein
MQRIDLRTIEPTAFCARLKKRCSQPAIPNAVFVPTPRVSLSYALNVLPVGSNPNQAHITAKIEPIHEGTPASPQQVYTEKGVFDTAVMLKTLSLPMGVEVVNALKWYSLANFEGTATREWGVSLLTRLGIPVDTAEALLDHAPAIRPGVTRPYLRPDSLRDRVVFGRHQDRHRVSIAVSDLNLQNRGATLSYQHIKAYVASMAMNLLVDATRMAGFQLDRGITVSLTLSVYDSYTALATSSGGLKPIPMSSDVGLRSLDWELLNTELSNVRAATDGTNARVGALIEKFSIIDKVKKKLTNKERWNPNSSNIDSARSEVKSYMSPVMQVGEAPAKEFATRIKTGIARLAAADRSIRPLLTLSTITDQPGMLDVFRSHREHVSKLTKCISDAIRQSAVWQNEDVRWAYTMSLMYSGAQVFISGTQLEDHIASAMTDQRGPKMIRVWIRQAANDISRVMVDDDKLELLGTVLAAEEHDMFQARDRIAGDIMDSYQRRYQQRASWMSQTVKESAMNGLLNRLPKDQARITLQNAKGKLVELQWLARTFELENVNLANGTIRMNQKIREIVREMANGFMRKRVSRSWEYTGPGSAHGDKSGTAHSKLSVVVDRSHSFQEMVAGLDALLGTHFVDLGNLLARKVKQVMQDVARLSRGYEEAITAATQGPGFFIRTAMEMYDEDHNLMDLTSLKAMLGRASYIPVVMPSLNEADMARIEMRDTFGDKFDQLGTGNVPVDRSAQIQLEVEDMYAGLMDDMLDLDFTVNVTAMDEHLYLTDWAENEKKSQNSMRAAIDDLGGHISHDGVVLQPEDAPPNWMELVSELAARKQGEEDRAALNAARARREETFQLA